VTDFTPGQDEREPDLDGPRRAGRMTLIAQARPKSWLLVVVCVSLCVLGAIGLTALGVWQLERRTWKLALIDRVEQRVHAAPAPMPLPPSWPAINAADDEYKRVIVAGQFMHDRETLVQALTAYGSGHWVLTPLRTVDGAIVLVNRGFVPPDRRDRTTRNDGNQLGTVTVSGLLRMTEPKGGCLRTNDPASGHWYSRDVAAIAAARGLSQVAPFFIDADAAPNPSGTPIGGLTVITFPNNHLIYALTWFALAFMAAAAALRIVLSKGHSRGPIGRLAVVL